MKNNRMLWLLLGIPAMLFLLLSASPTSVKDEKTILIHPDPIDDPDAPRSISASISAYYDTDLLCIYATLSNAGALVDVRIENITTGETSAGQIPGNTTSIIPISGTAGYWAITFTLENGDIYYGEFVL